ncbi:amidohydrolase [Streptomyces sp. NPDC049954]|uniref:amidohydrolase n=1 Tax=Streptomyces sp. NPDC049954 TaxID=3155779 RepID=UPI00343E7588
METLMPTSETVVYPARLVRTMDPARPTAQAVAVVGDRVRAVGSLDELRMYGDITIDERFADSVLFPGFVEAHTHPFGGVAWNFTYVGYYEAMSPDGRVWPGCQSMDAIVARLREAEAKLPADGPLVAWGLDPIYFPGERFDRRHLDAVSPVRPISVVHASGHLMTVNSAVLNLDGITRDTPVHGVVKDAAGEPTGELREAPALGLVRSVPSLQDRNAMGLAPQTLVNFARDARNHGTTTVTDLGNSWLLDDDVVARYHDIVDAEDFPARISSLLMATPGYGPGGSATPAAAADTLAKRRGSSTDKLRFGHAKLVLDGSIQGFTARLQAPGYLSDNRVGTWVIPPETFVQTFQAFHDAGLLVHVHCNGDEASELFIDTVERALERHPRWNHRHTVTHSQLTTAAQYRRMAALGMCANIFSNHLWYWGDQHHDLILGPDRAHRMNAAATALRSGVPITLHSDSPVTPLNPLATASYAASRTTPSGRVLGEHERITVPQALEAMTTGAAYTLKMDHEVGTIEAGKYADFAVLDQDPYVLAPDDLRTVQVAGTVLGGRHFPVSS